MNITRKFYSRYGEALKHMRFVDRLTPMTSKTYEEAGAVALRLDGAMGVQLLRMSSGEARALAAQLVTYAKIADDARKGGTCNVDNTIPA